MCAKSSPVGIEVTKDLNTHFRPTSWEEVKGQDSIKEVLKKQITSQQGLSNAYIFAGRSGVGKTTIARLFFKCLNLATLTPTWDDDSWKGDLLEVNASDTRGIDEMREVIKLARYVPNGKFRGILLDEAHMLTKPSWDCLLKPIEESQDKTIWIICTTELEKIPATIRTRCQIFRLNPLRWSDIKIRLDEITKTSGTTVKEEDLWSISRASDNNLRQAIHLYEQYSVSGLLTGIAPKEDGHVFLAALAKNDLKLIWQSFMQWNTKYDSLDACLNSLRYELANVLKVKLGIAESIPPYHLKVYQDYATKIETADLLGMLDQLFELQAKVSGIYDYNSLFLKALCQYKKVA